MKLRALAITILLAYFNQHSFAGLESDNSLNISRERQEDLVRLAQTLAEEAERLGNPPFGAVLIDAEGNVIETAFNTQISGHDPTAHAELNLFRKAANKLGVLKFGGYGMVSNAESCSMCFSGALKAKINFFIYGAVPEGHMDPWLRVSDVAKTSPQSIKIVTGVLGEECAQYLVEARARLSTPKK